MLAVLTDMLIAGGPVAQGLANAGIWALLRAGAATYRLRRQARMAAVILQSLC